MLEPAIFNEAVMPLWVIYEEKEDLRKPHNIIIRLDLHSTVKSILHMLKGVVAFTEITEKLCNLVFPEFEIVRI